MKKYIRPLSEGIAVGIVFGSICLLFQISYTVSIVIGLLAMVGGIRNSIKMDAAKKAKEEAKHSSDKSE